MNTKQMSAVLDELEARAGASDSDREAWLLERLSGITATEIRDLIVKGPAFRNELLAIKRGDATDSFAPNRYTAWGKKREPVIAAQIQERFGIAPESRVFHRADNPRFLASPDGIGVVKGELVLAEIKATKKNLAPGGREFDSSGYAFQMQWQMFVTGATRCLFAWERHAEGWHDVGGEFEEPNVFEDPFSGVTFEHAWIERDQVVIDRLVKEAESFLRAVDGADAREVDPEIDRLAGLYFVQQQAEAAAKKAKEALGTQIKALIGDQSNFSQIGTFQVTLSAKPVETDVVDEDAARAERPKTFERFEAAKASRDRLLAKFTHKEWVQGRSTFRVTKPKPKEKSE